MPYHIIEHSDDLASLILMDSTFQGALSSDLFDVKDIKVRAMPFQHYQVGFESRSFIHVSLRILSGRSEARKQILSKSVIEKLSNLNINKVSIIAEVLDIDRDSYQKELT
ncbi:5-carboxymethyl-2-hydroxymuconate isomerase [Shewanella sp. 202IG2-18]|uniref:5-carboxymethyl-2-hydroxymuconate Delta-isomerase n=1 Tax=Parashewanella hymeniacidonis TaxID=2807618 RepID=UPI00195F7D6C|nr:5-carboxymethyl-2-hydroxymuconate isomerase [Parashewanella hymeniacidonis]MBM7073756.1 5-carboxymethyl-2-hydroxymuconate isomerase [Parashewanella hymeniacidonis]